MKSVLCGKDVALLAPGGGVMPSSHIQCMGHKRCPRVQSLSGITVIALLHATNSDPSETKKLDMFTPSDFVDNFSAATNTMLPVVISCLTAGKKGEACG